MAKEIQEVLDLAGQLRKNSKTSTAADAIEVDPFFIEDPKVKKVIEFAISRRKNAYLVGPTGCGKSSGIINVAARLKEEMEIVSLDGESSKDDIIGKLLITPTDKGEAVTSEAPGPALRAVEQGKILLLEEVDMANPDILAALHRILETQSKFITVNIGQTRTIKKHPRFMCVATANTVGWGEDTFLYAGTKPQNQAFMNRFGLTVQMDYLDEVNEVKVVCDKTGVSKSLAEPMVKVAREVRAARTSASDRVMSIISTRDLLEWADIMSGINVRALEAAEYAFLNRMAETDREIVEKFITNRF